MWGKYKIGAGTGLTSVFEWNNILAACSPPFELACSTVTQTCLKHQYKPCALAGSVIWCYAMEVGTVWPVGLSQLSSLSGCPKSLKQKSLCRRIFSSNKGIRVNCVTQGRQLVSIINLTMWLTPWEWCFVCPRWQMMEGPQREQKRSSWQTHEIIHMKLGV